MSKAGRRAVLVLPLAACAALFGPPAASAAASCAGHPKRLSFQREVGKLSGRLSWRAPAGARRVSYRVYRGHAVVGQTNRRWLEVAVRPGRSYVFTVRIMSARGKATACAAKLRRRIIYHPPFPPRGIAVKTLTDSSATLTWSAARRGDGRLYGYRVLRDGRVYRQVKTRWIRVPLTTARTYRFAVAAADTRGRLSRLSRTLTVTSRHHPPGAPGALRAGRVTDSEVSLEWSAGHSASSRIVGYRLYRDGTLVRQVAGTADEVSNLAPATDYRFTVAAIDSLGYLSTETDAVAVTTAMPAPTEGKIHAFLLASTDESFLDLQRHYRQIGTLYPTYFECPRTVGDSWGPDDPLVTRWAQLRRIKVLPRFDCQRRTTLHQMLTDPTARAVAIDQMMTLVRTHGYDGVNVDFEGAEATDRGALTSFVTALASQLHAIGKQITVEVSAKYTETYTGRSGFYDYTALGAVADNVFVMTWGWHYLTSPPGATDDITKARLIADYVATMPNKSRYVIGVPMYGIDWANGGGPTNRGTPLEHADVMDQVARYGGTPVLDPTVVFWHYTYTNQIGYHDVWYADASTIFSRVRIAQSRGLGLGFWRLGREDQRVWDNPLIAPGTSWP
jgi:spore germination protein YaaH